MIEESMGEKREMSISLSCPIEFWHEFNISCVFFLLVAMLLLRIKILPLLASFTIFFNVWNYIINTSFLTNIKTWRSFSFSLTL